MCCKQASKQAEVAQCGQGGPVAVEREGEGEGVNNGHKKSKLLNAVVDW